MSALWQKAASFAARCHGGQLRKDGKTPYVAHPCRVALTVRHLFGVDDEVALCTALLHDVIEDTTADFDSVAREFGSEVSRAVACLSKDKRLPETEREERFYQQIAAGSWQARLVKLADAYDNVCDAANPVMKAKALEKAQRTLVVAGDEPQLQRGIVVLRELIEREMLPPA